MATEQQSVVAEPSTYQVLSNLRRMLHQRDVFYQPQGRQNPLSNIIRTSERYYNQMVRKASKAARKKVKQSKVSRKSKTTAKKNTIRAKRSAATKRTTRKAVKKVEKKPAAITTTAVAEPATMETTAAPATTTNTESSPAVETVS